MKDSEQVTNLISRRQALALGGGVVAAGLLAGGGVGLGAGTAGAAEGDSRENATLPVDTIQSILEASGTVTNGVLVVGIDRTDIGTVTLRGVPIKPSFEVNGDLTFQPVGGGRAFFNGDLALKDNEVNAVIDAILAGGLVFQAEHQHFYDFDPPVWFIHFRGQGNALQLARAVHHVLKATATPLPQSPPANPSTPLDKDKLQHILHGYDADVGDDGVVTVHVARRDSIYIDGVRVRPQTNIATNVAFEPLNAGGTRCAVAPDFAMESNEINRVTRVMRRHGWDVGCLYNQETDEKPQLFFSHQFKTGDPYVLAREVRAGLNETNSH
jgi:hypothetical protein